MHAVENADGTIAFDERRLLAEHGDNMREVFKTVQERLATFYGESALSLQVGQTVWKKNYTLSDKADYYAAKLAPKFIKCTVVRKISTNVYELVNIETRRSLGNVHIKDIKIY
uniref:Uncharacterized protein n=1 Tax=Anoplophora glabripennis TaxID=217634 RepID=V5I8C8_ANOGL